MAARRSKTGPLETAVRASIKALGDELDTPDAAMVELAFAYARRIDIAQAGDDVEAAGKLLGWLGPHLANLLRSLGVSPEGRKTLGIQRTKEVGKLAELRERRRDLGIYHPSDGPLPVTERDEPTG